VDDEDIKQRYQEILEIYEQETAKPLLERDDSVYDTVFEQLRDLAQRAIKKSTKNIPTVRQFGG